jgi:hypothetical protein
MWCVDVRFVVVPLRVDVFQPTNERDDSCWHTLS